MKIQLIFFSTVIFWYLILSLIFTYATIVFSLVQCDDSHVNFPGNQAVHDFCEVTLIYILGCIFHELCISRCGNFMVRH